MEEQLYQELKHAQSEKEVKEALEELYGYAHFLMIMGFITGYERRTVRNKEEVIRFLGDISDVTDTQKGLAKIERAITGGRRFGDDIASGSGISQQERWLQAAHNNLKQGEEDDK